MGTLGRDQGKKFLPVALARLMSVTLLGILACVGVGSQAPPAFGDNWWGATGNAGDPPYCGAGVGNRADARPHTFFYADLEERTSALTTWARTRIENTEIRSAPRVPSLAPSTDVVVLDRYYEDYCEVPWDERRVIGFVYCRSLQDNGRCQQHDLRINLTYFDSISPAKRRATLLHEVGQTISLKHRDTGNGAMQSRVTTDQFYTQHDRDHIRGAEW